MLPSLLALLLLPSPLLGTPAHADEGMWLPEQLRDHAERLDELGLQLPLDQLSDPEQAPLGAIVSLGFCSASFVSPDGLIATNHHCVAGYLQQLSSAEENRAREGYLAPSRDQELSAGPGARLWIVEEISDVTDQVVGKLPKRLSDKQREARIDRAEKEIVAACEATPDTRCRVATMYSGLEYKLLRHKELRDVRVVYAPHERVGDYGGEIDNWMWPRHSGDFSLLRAYVAPDGQSADYSPDNVPYRPPHWLPIDPTGAQDGELVMVAGFPGRTSRYARAESLRFARDVEYPDSIEVADQSLAILRDEAGKSDEAAARLAAPIGWIENGRKYRQGMLDNFRRSRVVERVEAREQALRDWIAADRVRTRIYGPVLDELHARHEERSQRWAQDVLHGRLLSYVDLLGVADTAVRLATERQKPDLERDAGYQQRDEDRIAARFARMDKSLWLPADRRVLAMLLARHAALPADQRIPALDAFVAAHGGADATVDLLFQAPALADAAARQALLETDLAGLKASQDPWIQLALALEAWDAPRRDEADERAGAGLRLGPQYMQALLGSRPGAVYPDADSTLRVTFGQVKGYQPRDGVWHLPHTTVAGVVEKAGDDPFDAPDKVLAAAARSPQSRWADPDLGDVPVDFLATLDTTGGNSGSATINAKGELVGLIFDGNYEAMSADWLFDDDLTRSIHVDVRYILWMLDDVEGAPAKWILDELLGE
ncbi:MAG: S46 family peptidase [Alphaproteobacteria bacterium]|nr:S46 family peptidase [Alphaproteobacteria bacterium]